MTWADALSLGKWRISLLAALSALAGSAAFSAAFTRSPRMLAPLLGAYALALGACALNQVQERRLDARMERTRRRPVAAGRVAPGEALALAAALLAAGGATLALGAGAVPALLGAVGVVWYNGLYTWLKRRTAFAAVPGALVGAVPPAIGWIAAGGAVLDPRLGVLAAILVVWQLPHFWFLLLRVGAEYEAAGLPSLGRHFSPRGVSRIAFTWLVAASLLPGLLPAYGLGRPGLAWVYAALGWSLAVANGAVLIATRGEGGYPRFAFRSVNAYLVLLLALLIADRLLRAA